MTDFKAVKSQRQIAQVARLAHIIWHEHYDPIIGRAQVDYMLKQFQSQKAISQQISDSHKYYHVIEDKQAVGYLGIIPEPENDRMMLSKIYLEKSERGRGIGENMLDFVEELCRQQNISTLFLKVNKENTNSIAWYKRNGFKKTAAPVTDIGKGFVMDDYKMEKNVRDSP